MTDVAVDSKGNYFVGEYGNFDRIQIFDSDGNYVDQFGGHGFEPGQFLRPQGFTIDRQDRVWVADACNHRIQVFVPSEQGYRLEKSWGEMGTEEGQLRYPYGIVLDQAGNVYVSEWGNNRVQKFSSDGQSLGTWGGPGKDVGQMSQPWGLVLDSQGFVHVLDSYNNRVQRFKFPD